MVQKNETKNESPFHGTTFHAAENWKRLSGPEKKGDVC